MLSGTTEIPKVKLHRTSDPIPSTSKQHQNKGRRLLRVEETRKTSAEAEYRSCLDPHLNKPAQQKTLWGGGHLMQIGLQDDKESLLIYMDIIAVIMDIF